MEWVIPQFSRTKVDQAGTVLRTGSATSRVIHSSREVLGNWRAAHAFPLNTMQMNLRQRARRVDAEALVAQRLKRETSILRKLERFPQMRLTQMQDIGGCRAVLRTIEEVEQLSTVYRKNAGSHEIVNEKDYVSKPPHSGYRSVHITQRYKSAQKPEFTGLLIEVQIRSLLQHAWATAVETVDAFLGTDLKSSLGPKDWQRTFALLGAAFANSEGTPPVPGTPSDERRLHRAISDSVRDVGLLDHLHAWSQTVREVTGEDFRAQKYLLLEMRPDQGITRVFAFRQRELEFASVEYARLESEVADIPRAQAVLVSTDSIKNLRRSYPSYFADSTLFLAEVRRMLDLSV